MIHTQRLIIAAATGLMLSGCGLIYKPVGHTLNHYSLDEAVPYALASGDLNKSTCGTGLALTQLMGSFSSEITRPSRLLLSTNTLAAMCSEKTAQDAHLLVLRDLYKNDVVAARDDRVVAQRAERITALRRFQVYRDTVLAYGPLGAGECPDLTNAMGTDLDEVQYMTGVLTSVQAVLNDIQAESTVGIPQDIAAKAGRASQCMDNQKWWGVPKALQAVIWLSVPGKTPDGVDPWQQLEQAADYGEQQGMALAPMLYALAAYNQSENARERQAIAQVNRAYASDNAPHAYQILNEVAYSQARYLSDRMWIQAEGRRTPLLALGTFPGESNSGGDIDTSSYLN